MASTRLSSLYPPCLGSECNNDDKPTSPFRSMDAEIYLYRDIECTEKEKGRISQHTLKVHEKSTISSRARSRKAFRKLEEAIERDTQGEIEKDITAQNWALAFAKCCQSDKQSITDYISEQKELFLLEYAVKIKQRTMSKLEKMAAKEERRAKIAETKLEEDTIAFEEFLKENDRSSVDALKIATQEAKSKMEVTLEVRSAMNEVFSLKSEIANTEDLLLLYLSYEAFLLSISPEEWQEQQQGKRKKWKKEKKRGLSKSFISIPGHDKNKLLSTSLMLHHRITKWAHFKEKSHGKKTGKSASIIFSDHEEKKKSPQNQGGDYRFFRKPSKLGLSHRSSLDGRKKSSIRYSSERSLSLPSEEDFSLEDIQSDEDPEIYFKDPGELLQILSHLEEQNLSLFQNIQEISGTLEDRQQIENAVKQQMEQKIQSVLDEKEALIAACLKEEEKSAEVALKAKVFSSGEYNPASADKMLNTLNKKIAEIYKVCCGADEASSMTSFYMLKKIEIRVSELCEMMEALPKGYRDAVETIEKLRAKERRRRVREDKLKELKRIQEERLKLALERAIAAPKKREGRKLVYRSQPPETRRREENVIDLTTRSEDDYYFT
ncbi:coiled-coil domain-containing protein 38 [Elgaria multicarinata webbii]|uniref:coiled-coil domain-containing protein 38 n=1 Tax=Elgaria multicarinata webbii TaxID=159646 RepID=UPI002FCD548F